MDIWSLPQQVELLGKSYGFRGDYRNVFQIFRCLNDPDRPLWMRWLTTVELFYEERIPQEALEEAIRYLVWFLNGGQEEIPQGPRLLDWEQDGAMIVADVNRVAGTEVRALPFLHWWTFLSWFHGIGEGQLSTVVSIRDKLARGRKLEQWEQEYYQRNRHRVELKERLSREELDRRERVKKMLG